MGTKTKNKPGRSQEYEKQTKSPATFSTADSVKSQVQPASWHGAISSEIVPGLLPKNQNSPQLIPIELSSVTNNEKLEPRISKTIELLLSEKTKLNKICLGAKSAHSEQNKAPAAWIAEQISGTSFTTPRAANKRSWLYRLQASAQESPLAIATGITSFDANFDAAPNPLRWNPLTDRRLEKADFPDWISGLLPLLQNGNPDERLGGRVYLYVSRELPKGRIFCNREAEMLFVPQKGTHTFRTEMGVLEVGPGEICVIPQGIHFSLTTKGAFSRGYILENFGAHLRLPELGPIGANGLASERHFFAPIAEMEFDPFPDAYRNQIFVKFANKIYLQNHALSPFNVGAWWGNLYPYKYDLRQFNTIGSISFDHPDPSIFTVLTSPSSDLGVANFDLVIFPERWLVQEHTFRPPYYHKNVMSEYMGLIFGAYDAKPDGFLPGGGSLHNMMCPHGPDSASFVKASTRELIPQKLEHTLAFMFESKYPFQVNKKALEKPLLQEDYWKCWF